MTLLSAGFVVAGIVLLYLGGEALVRGAVDLSRLLGLSPMVIGLTVVAFATSSPELAATLTAALRGVPEVAVGNILGSNIANVGLILGAAALLQTIRGQRSLVRREVPVMLGVSLLLWPLFRDGAIDRVEGLVLVALLAAYLWYYLRRPEVPVVAAVSEEVVEELAERPPRSALVATLLVAAGVALLVGGAWMLVEGAVAIARALGVSERVVGLTMVALGTSLPELSSSLVAARHGHGDLVLGNVIGSNIFNVLGIFGLTALVVPIPVGPGANLDFWTMIAFSLAPLPLLWPDLELGRGQGAVLVVLYLGYVGWLFG